MTDAAAILEALDPEQRQVATSFGAPVCVIAGAGTGKTRAITHRIAYGASTGVLDPRRTLAVTFTTRAAGTMRTRLEELGVRGVQARTIHSAALRQVRYFWPRAYGCELPPVSDGRFPLVAESARRAGLGVDTALLRDLSAEISWAKVSNIPADQYAPLARAQGRVVASVSSAMVGRILAGYEAAKQEAGVIDLDDILLCAVGLLSDHPDVAEQVRSQYRHFVVDEYQDVSPIQHSLLELWFDGRDDVCVVGDPHQSIHAFAGARADYLMDFVTDHPGARRIELVRNYRSTEPVVALANTVLVHHLDDEERAHHGQGVRLRGQGQPGPAPHYASFADDTTEADAVAQWFRTRHEAGTPWSQMAALHRVNSQSPALESALAAADVPYVVKGAERFYERAEVRRTLTMLARRAETDPDAGAQLADAVLADQGWTDQPPEGHGAVRQRWESLQALHEVVRSVRDADPAATLAAVVAELGERARRQDVPVSDGVTLCTMHAAKGLEWDVVALVGVSDTMVPFIMAESPEELAEERRLLHVAVTRARRELWISFPRTGAARGRWGISRFLRGLPGTPRQGTARGSAPGRRRGHRVVDCSVCGGPLTAATDRKLGHHLACEVDVSPDLVDRLRAWRKERAEADSVPPYVVLTDVSLLAVAEHLPEDEQALLALPGIGRRKVERYAADLLAVLHGSSSDAPS